MKRLLVLLSLLSLFAVPAMAAGSSQSASVVAGMPQPHQVVQKATKEVLARIVKDRPQYDKNPDHLYTIIEENLVPYVDFDRIAKRVMAKYYLNATADQRARFRDAFKRSLIRAYGSALRNYDDQRFEVLPPGRGEVETERATVNMNITMKDGTVYRIVYSMFLAEDGAWRLENLILEGVNLGLTYKNNFAEMASQYGGDIDKVIANWSSRVEAEKKKQG